MKKLISVLTIAAILMCTFASFCFAEGITVTDQAGNEVAFEKPAERIVSCYYISTATLIALGLEDELVGIEMKADTRGLYELAAPQIISLPAVGSGKGINVEEIASLEPDVVILPIKLKDDAAILNELGIKVIVVNPESQAQFEECVLLLGEITGTGDIANGLVKRCADMSAAISQATEGLDRPRVYMASGSDLFTTFPAGIYQHDLITIAGGENVAAAMEGSGKVTVDAEQLIAWNPEYIFIVADADYTVGDVLANDQLSGVDAVINGNVFVFPSDIEAWDYPTPSALLGQVYLASVLHPEAVTPEMFEDTALAFYSEVFGIDITIEDIIK